MNDKQILRNESPGFHGFQNRKPKIIVLAHSKTWCSLIERFFPEANLCWLLDADALLEEATKQNAHAAIVEIPIENVDSVCVKLSEIGNNSQGLKLFSVGDAQLHHWRKLMRVAGIAYSCWSILQADSLKRAVEKHLQTVAQTTSRSHQSLESFFESDLPWPTAANDTTT